MFHTCTIFCLCLVVLASSAVGTSNGMALYVDEDGHLAVEAPHLSHARSHAEGADHDHHDRGPDTDHGDLHHLLGSCSDAQIVVQKLDRASARLAPDHALADVALALPAWFVTAIQPSAVRLELTDPAFHGCIAHPDLASLRSVVLLV